MYNMTHVDVVSTLCFYDDATHKASCTFKRTSKMHCHIRFVQITFTRENDADLLLRGPIEELKLPVTNFGLYHRWVMSTVLFFYPAKFVK